ncbi:major facilitator superfamily domain-containing protein [Aspergillus pseudoustus]|uniref:Major facilitator superfamily domain-containing protein n=1 Tax=Aspergillus pseudoustus TaxID=1810923 RepID=A0ABR4KMI1_9EURO
MEDSEKASTKFVEDAIASDSRVNIDVDEEYSYEQQRKIIHRVNRRLVSICGVAYCISLMDRANVSMAASTVVLIFFVTYIVCQPLATGIIRKIGPRIYITGIVLTWGGCLIVPGFFPGAVYLLSTWYSRYEIQKRYTWVYLIGCVASASVHGLQGHSGWRWIFIMQGILSFTVGLLCWVFVVDFPDKAHKVDRGDASPVLITLKKFLGPALDLKLWGFALIFFCPTTVAYAIAYFLPIIFNENMHFSIAASQCMNAPPYAFAGILIVATSWAGDKYPVRALILVLDCIITLVGLSLMGFAASPGANNIRRQWTRAFASATLVSFGGIGGIAVGLVFRSQDARALVYIPGIWATIAISLLIM